MYNVTFYLKYEKVWGEWKIISFQVRRVWILSSLYSHICMTSVISYFTLMLRTCADMSLHKKRKMISAYRGKHAIGYLSSGNRENGRSFSLIMKIIKRRDITREVSRSVEVTCDRVRIILFLPLTDQSQDNEILTNTI